VPIRYKSRRELSAARVPVFFDLFTVMAQQFSADIVDIIDIIAVFFEAIDQPCTHFFALWGGKVRF
jgi:hypothetical protein